MNSKILKPTIENLKSGKVKLGQQDDKYFYFDTTKKYNRIYITEDKFNDLIKQTKSTIKKEKIEKIIKETKKIVEKSMKKKLNIMIKKEYDKGSQLFKDVSSQDNYGKVLEVILTNGEKKYITINSENRILFEAMRKGNMKQIEISIEELGFSDAVIIEYEIMGKIDDYNIIDRKEHFKARKAGAFFKYYHKMNIDLKKYGILTKKDENYYNDNCLINALRELKIDEIKLNSIKLKFKNQSIPIIELKNICEILGISIKLNQLCKDKRVIKTYGKSKEKIYNLCLIDEHYFILDTTNITTYAINNYEQIKDKENWNHITHLEIKKGNKHYHLDKRRCIDSFTMVKLLLEKKNELLTEITIEDVIGTVYYNKALKQEIKDLNYVDDDVKLYEESEQRDISKDFIVFFDFETVTTKMKDDVHIPYMVHYLLENENKSNYHIGDINIGYRVLDSICNKIDKDLNIVMIAHNMRYDLSFLSKYLHSINCIRAGSKIIGLTGFFKKRKLIIKDSYCMISKPLRDFAKCFGFENKEKEIISYDMYNDLVPKYWLNNADIFYDVDEINNKYYAPSGKSADFLNNIKKWNLRGDNNKFDIMKYASIYCEMDCIILKDGYKKFREWITEAFEVDIRSFYSIASCADRILKNKGCYDNTFSLSGAPRLFISESVVGGRTMTSQNKKAKYANFEKINFDKKYNNKEEEIIEIKNNLIKNINDFDGVSLYPSSMYRMDGFIKGKPKVIVNKTYDDLKTKDFYFVEILIKKIGVKRNFPLVSLKNDQNVRIFNNDMINKKLIVNKITLEDLIEFQKVEFEIIRGYYFDEGFNTKIKEVILNIFETRIQKKKEGNKIEEIYKLIMNSSYGKTILKEQDVTYKYFNNKETGINYMLTNYNKVISGDELYNDNKFLVKQRNEIQSHMNYCHIGSHILAMSKRIMNEVICLAEDNNIEIFYQDTDSMHLNDEDIEKLSKLFKEKYNRELIGKKLGQFHSDFKMSEINEKCQNVYAIGSLFLGKKCYLDVLCDKEFKNIMETHIRLKGIPTKSINYTATKLYGHKSDVMNIIHLYYDLYNGKKIIFDLLCDMQEIKFKTFDLTVKTISEFSRQLSF
jgi:hypothetical protein